MCNYLDEEKIAGCLILIVILISCDCLSSVAVPHAALGWSAMCNCCISVFLLEYFFKFCGIFPNFQKKKIGMIFYEIIMPYLLFLKKNMQNFNCCLLQIIGGALRVKAHERVCLRIS